MVALLAKIVDFQTHVINVTIFVKMGGSTIGAKELSYISCFQMLQETKISWTY